MDACTIVARNYLAYARVVAGSFLDHHPGGRFWVLVVDETGDGGDGDEPFTVLRLDDIGLDAGEIRRMAAIYDVTELATAVKPWLLRHLLGATDAVVYLDPDVRVYAPFGEVADLAREHGIVLTPHTVDPIPRDSLRPSEGEILASGVYNLGFLGVGRAALPMLEWWCERLARDCVIDHARMLFTDQRWVDLVPGYYPHHIVTSRAYNVAYWNLHARPVTWTGERYEVDGEPLRFFHFSGFDPDLPDVLSKHQGEAPRVTLAEHPDLRKLFDEYADALRSAGHASARRAPYGWGTAPGGHVLDRRARRVYRDALLAYERGGGDAPPNPFSDGGDAFAEWLRSPERGQRGAPPVSRYLLALYADRPDVRAAFPDVPGADNARYLRWVATDGVRQEGLPPAQAPSVGRRRSRTAAPAAAAEIADPGRPSFAPKDALVPGVNVAGYFKAELGVGEGGRLVLDTVAAAGVDHCTVTTTRTSSRQGHPFVDRGRPGAPYDVNIVCVNADQTPHFARDVGPGFFAGRYTIGMWHWEVDEFPPVMHAGFDYVDEVWCGSEFTAASVRRSTDKPVYAFPLPIVPPAVPLDVTRADLGLPEGRTVFLFAFDFFSRLERKNPVGVVAAFTRAFAPDEGPVLVLKSVNGFQCPEHLARLREAVGDRPDVVIRDEYLSAPHKAALMGLADCYVSLHRSEGFGLTVAEAMALGKPVVVTDYAGTTDFATDDNAFLVPYGLTTIPPGCEPYPEGGRWADPDVDAAAAHMRTVVDRPGVAAAKAARARHDVLTLHSVESRVPFVRERLADIRARRGSIRLVGDDVRARLSPAVANAAPPLPPERGVERAIRLVNTVPDIRSATDKGALAYFVRRVVRRLTNHQTRHQHEVDMALAVGLHELSDRATETDARLASTADRIDATAEAARQHAEAVEERAAARVAELRREVDGMVRDQLQDALTNGWSYELGVQMRAHLYSLLVDSGVFRAQTYAALAALQERVEDRSLAASELRVFSQNGEDGVIAELLRRLGPGGKHFVEFGIESGREGNCVLLADVFGWSGLFIEADDDFSAALESKYAANDRVTTLRSFVTPENVTELFRSAGVPDEPDVLSIDVDGADYWIWEGLDAAFRPRIVVVEYNSGLGAERALVQPRDAGPWDKTDYYGASIAAVTRLAAAKGYSLVYQELSGNNAFFVRDDLVPALGDVGVALPRTPNYSLNAERHPGDPHGRRYLDLDTNSLVDRP